MRKNQIHEVLGLADPSPVCRRRHMRIVCDLQLSNKLPNSSRFLFAKDSNTVIKSIFIRAIKKYRPDWSVTVLVPYPEQIVGIKGEQYAKDAALDDIRSCFRGAADWSNLHLVPYRYVPEAFTQRFNFNVNELMPHFKSLQHEYDMVYCNEPAQAQNWNMMMFGRRLGDIVPVVSYYHWITGWTDRKGATERLDWIIRHGEGLFHSVLGLAASKTAVSLLVEGLRPYFNRRYFEHVIPKLAALVEPTDSTTLLAKKDLGTRSTEGPLRMIWAHRLNDYTGWDECFDALKTVHDKRPGSFTVWVPDPGDRVKQEVLHERWPFIEMLDKSAWSFDDYAKLCWSSHVVLGNHRRLAVWGGLALSESQLCGCFPLVPDCSWYREQVGPPDDDNITFFEWKKPEALAAAANKLLDKPRSWVMEQGAKMSKFVLATIDVDPYAERMIGFLESVCYPRRELKWTRYIQDAAKSGFLDGLKMNLAGLYNKMFEWEQKNGLNDPETGKPNKWPFVRKNLWPSIRRQVLDHEILVDDPTDPDGLYSVGPGAARDDLGYFEPEEDPLWRENSSSPWLHRADWKDVTPALKGKDGITHPVYSINTEEALEDNEIERADLVEIEDAAELYPKADEPPAPKKTRKKNKTDVSALKTVDPDAEIIMAPEPKTTTELVQFVDTGPDKPRENLDEDLPAVAETKQPELVLPKPPEMTQPTHNEGMTQVSEVKADGLLGMFKFPVFRQPVRQPIKKTE
jgi:hypothetical protein